MTKFTARLNGSTGVYLYALAGAHLSARLTRCIEGHCNWSSAGRDTTEFLQSLDPSIRENAVNDFARLIKPYVEDMTPAENDFALNMLEHVTAFITNEQKGAHLHAANAVIEKLKERRSSHKIIVRAAARRSLSKPSERLNPLIDLDFATMAEALLSA